RPDRARARDRPQARLRARERRGRPRGDAVGQRGERRPRDSPRRRDQIGIRSVAYEFKLPDLGEGLTEGEISRWLVSEGQEIAEDDPLVEIQTDKTTVEIPSPAAGTVSRILVEEGKVVPVGTVLVVIGGERDGDQPVQPPAPTTAEPRARATPDVPKIAQELGVDLDSLAGTGPQG